MDSPHAIKKKTHRLQGEVNALAKLCSTELSVIAHSLAGLHDDINAQIASTRIVPNRTMENVRNIQVAIQRFYDSSVVGENCSIILVKRKKWNYPMDSLTSKELVE